METAVKRHFARIARAYDRANDLLSLGMDRGWRRRAVELLPPGGGVLLDLASGTGACAAEVLEQGRAARVLALDFCPPMLRAGWPRARVARCGADAQRLPLADASVDACCLAWGWRNLPGGDRVLAELHRVLRPGGHLLVIDFFRPRAAWPRLFLATYATLVMPLLGGLVTGSVRAWLHLRRSIRAFHDVASADAALARAGFGDTRWLGLAGGVCHAVAARQGRAGGVTPVPTVGAAGHGNAPVSR